MDYGSIRKNIRELRSKLGLSQKEMAERMGVSRVAYSNLERGVTSLRPAVLEKIAAIGGIPMEELMLGYVPDEGVTHLREELTREYGDERARLIKAYEDEIEKLGNRVEALENLVESQSRTIGVQEEMISMLKRRLPKED